MINSRYSIKDQEDVQIGIKKHMYNLDSSKANKANKIQEANKANKNQGILGFQ